MIHSAKNSITLIPNHGHFIALINGEQILEYSDEERSCNALGISNEDILIRT